MRFPILSLLLLLQWPIATNAQIVPDQTLSAPSIVTTTGNTQTITGGTGAGDHLFHSFSQFSIETGNTALFVHHVTAKNLLVRVTGNRTSEINGVLQTRLANSTQASQANLFLLNPNGISFGKDARLVLQGSFLASTAESIRLSNGSEFSARNPTTPLLTIATPIGLQFGHNPGKLTNQSTAVTPGSTQALGLQVRNGKTLALLGGDVEMIGGLLFATPGNIEVAAIGDNTNLGFAVQENGTLGFDYSNVDRWRDISFSNRARAQVTATGKSINLLGRNITIAAGSQIVSAAVASSSNADNAMTINAKNDFIVAGDNSRILSAASTAGIGADIQVKAQNLRVEQRGNIGTLVERQGNQGGDIVVNVQDQIILNGIQLSKSQFDAEQANSGIFANSLNFGNSGNIVISGRSLVMQNGANLNSLNSRNGSGKAGDITLKDFQDITISGAIVKFINAPADSSLLGQPTTIATKTQNQADAGKLAISTQHFNVLDGAQIVTSTTSGGNAGRLDITAKEIAVGGVAKADNQFLYQSLGNRLASNIASDAQPNSTGQGATLRINTDRLTVKDGAVIQTATFSRGDAGDIDIVANQSILLEGIAPNPDDRFPSSIIALSGGLPGERAFGVPTATGKGGQISITTPELQLSDGAQIAIGRLNPTSPTSGGGEKLTLNANTIILDRAKLNAETNAGNGGNMVINARNLLLLRNGSKIVTIAGSADQPGNGGNIAITSPLIVAREIEDSDIRADSFSGNGGRIDLRVSSSILGLKIRSQATDLSDITSTSRFGQPGEINLVTPDIDPSRGTAQLPSAPNDSANRIDKSCSTSSTVANRFTVQGDGGLPATPTTTPTSPIVRLANLPNVTQTSTIPQPNLTIREAQQVQRLAQGKIRFTVDRNHPAEVLTSKSQCQ